MSRFIVIAAALAGCAMLVTAMILRPDAAAGPCALANAPAAVPELPEASGLAVSRRHPGLLWSHNDSGNDTVLFALDAAGALRGRVRVPVRTRDWEDLSAGRCPSGQCLYVADIGDNGRRRRRVQLFRVPEPAPGEVETARPEIFSVAYEDGPHNAEAMFVIDDEVFVVTRDRTGGLYRSTAPLHGDPEITLRRIGELGLGAVTDAEASPDEKVVAVRTSHEVVLYRAAELIQGTIAPYLRVSIDGFRETQGEGVALDGDMLYLASEGGPWNRSGNVLSLRCEWSE